jgi:hypothetical protein
MSTHDNNTIIVLLAGLLCAGAGILYVEVVRNQCRNYATTVFQGSFVLLFVAIPLAIHVSFGGAQSIVSGTDTLHTDLVLYLIYIACVAAILTGQMIVTMTHPLSVPPKQRSDLAPPALRARLWAYIGVLGAGWYLYVRATGMGLFELISASRFSWFSSDQHSIIVSVVADYLIAATPVFFFLALVYGKSNRNLTLMGILILVGYAVCSKDRKWLIYGTSGILAAYYVRSNASIKLRPAAVAAGLLVVSVLAFWQVARDTIFNYALGMHTNFGAEASAMATRLLRFGDAPYYYHASIEAISQGVKNDFFIPLGVLRRQLFFFLPVSYSFGLKPEDIPALFSDVVHGGDDLRRGNMPPSLVGTFVISFKWYATPLLLAGIPFVLRALDRFIVHRRGLVRDVLLSTLLSSTILLLRGDDAGATYFVVSNLLIGSSIHFAVSFFGSDARRQTELPRPGQRPFEGHGGTPSGAPQDS